MPGRCSHSATDPTIQIVTHFPGKLLDKLEARAVKDGVSRSEVVRQAVISYLEAVALHLNGGEA